MSTPRSQNRVSPLERYIQSFSPDDQEELNRTNYPPSVHQSFQGMNDGSQLWQLPICKGHDGELFAAELPDDSDEEAPRIRLRDCVEFADKWLTFLGDNTPRRHLLGHWTIQDWSTGHENRISIVSYKTWLIRIRPVGEDLNQMVIIGAQDIYLILRRLTAHYSEVVGDELPPIQGKLQYQDPSGRYVPVVFFWELVPMPKESLVESIRQLRVARREASERQRELQRVAIVKVMLHRRPYLEAIEDMKRSWGLHTSVVEQAQADDTVDTSAYEDMLDSELKNLFERAQVPGDGSADDVDDLPLRADDRARLILDANSRAMGIRLDREQMQWDYEARMLEAQQAILPQAMAARDRAVEASTGGERVYDTNTFPRSADDLYQYTHNAWTFAFERAVTEPMMYSAAEAPSSSAMTANAIDHLLDSVNAGVIGTDWPDDEAGPSRSNVFDYQQR